nr:TonB-dependent receptor [Acinetobacter soli]
MTYKYAFSCSNKWDHLCSFYAYQNGNLNSTPVHINGFARLDAAIGYSFAPWNVTLAVNNVTDKQYWRSAELPGTPRNVLLRFGYQF